MYACMYVCMYRVYICMHVCMYIRMYVYIYLYLKTLFFFQLDEAVEFAKSNALLTYADVC